MQRQIKKHILSLKKHPFCQCVRRSAERRTSINEIENWLVSFKKKRVIINWVDNFNKKFWDQVLMQYLFFNVNNPLFLHPRIEIS